MPWNFPVLAGDPLRRAGAGRRQRRRCSSTRPTSRSARWRSRICSGAPARPTGVFQTLLIGADRGRRDHRRPARRGRDRDRQRGGRQRDRRRRGQAPQEDGAGAGRQRPVHRACRAPTWTRAVDDGRQGAHHQQRPVVHRRQAFHRRRGRLRAVRRRASSPAMAALRGRRSDATADTQVGPLASPGIVDGAGRSGRAVGRAGARGARRAGAASTGRATSTRRRCWSTCRPTRRRARRSCSGRWRRCSASPAIDDAIALANATPFGLGASAWTRDRARGRAVRARAGGGLRVHQRHGRVRSRGFPFGGIKQSGYGRELGLRACASSPTSRRCGCTGL